jgi:hypothetical protein
VKDWRDILAPGIARVEVPDDELARRIVAEQEGLRSEARERGFALADAARSLELAAAHITDRDSHQQARAAAASARVLGISRPLPPRVAPDEQKGQP